MTRDIFGDLARAYRTPKDVQGLLKTLTYNREHGGETLRSAASALKAGTAHCFEAAFIASAILERHGHPPLVVSLESKDGIDHVIYVFQNQKNLWGSIARSRDRGLHGRAAVFKSLRQLCWSYYEPYIDKTGMLKAYQVFHLDETSADWRFSRKNLWSLERHLCVEKHHPLRSSRGRYRKLFDLYKAQGPQQSGRNWW